MSPSFAPICPPQAPCKCCGTAAVLSGVVDFFKNCAGIRLPLALSGIPIYYYRCMACRFLFTTAFDAFTKEEFARHVYNREYLLVDPEYPRIRPQSNAEFLTRLFANDKPLRLLDYGGGEGLLAELLRFAGFPHAETYDPFVPCHSTRPDNRYDLITCFEVAEHSTDPAATFADMSRLLATTGLILFSTLLQPADIDQQGLGWWYAGPRNGHVSLHTKESLEAIARPLGLHLASFHDGLHVLCRGIPDFARHFLQGK